MEVNTHSRQFHSCAQQIMAQLKKIRIEQAENYLVQNNITAKGIK